MKNIRDWFQFKRKQKLKEIQLEKNRIHAPIEKTLDRWIFYKENSPQCPYFGNREVHDQFRADNDLDCVLTGGNLNADTIFSLWTPLVETIKAIHGKQKLFKNVDTMNDIKSNLDYYLPADNPLVKKLSRLFELGMTRANVMILPNRSMNVLRYSITKDYMPHFLHLCFEPSSFRDFYKTDDVLIKWINEEHLKMFFENEDISQSNVRKLSGSDDVVMRVSLDLNEKLTNYIEILEKRSLYFM